MANGLPQINPLIATQVQVPDVTGAIGGGLQNAMLLGQIADRGKVSEKEKLQNELLGKQIQAQDASLAASKKKEELTSIRSGAIGALTALDTRGLDGATDFIERRIDAGATIDGGRGMVDTEELYARLIQDPDFNEPELRAELQTIITGIEAELGIDQRGAGAAEFSKGTEFITKDEEGNLILNTSTFNKRTGQTEIKKSPVNEKLVNKLGEEASEQTLREIEVAGGKAGAAAKEKLIVKASDDAAKEIIRLNSDIEIIDQGIAALDQGANVGILDDMLPSFQESTIKLDNIRNQLGLSVIGAVTFGALSKSEMDKAMATAFPKFNNSAEAKAWLQDRKVAQTKLRDFYVEIARRSKDEGKTPSEIIVEMEDKRKAEAAKNKTSAKSELEALEAELGL